MESSTISNLDRANMLGAIAAMPDQLRDGYSRAHEAAEAVATAWRSSCAGARVPRALVVCGMGGSGVGADLVPAVFDTTTPVIAVKGYDLPEWVGADDRVLCLSYSGNTAETLSCFAQATERSIVAAVATSGGKLADSARGQGIPVVDIPSGQQPRAAVGLLFGSLVALTEALGVVTGGEECIEQCAQGANRVIELHEGAEGADVSADGSDDDLPALAMARQLQDSIVVVYGSGPTAPVAHRWKAQINENAKIPSFANDYPELNHNELVGWQYAGATGGRWSLVELVAANVRPELRRRMDITRELIADELHAALRLDALSVSRAGCVFEQLVWGDYVSVYLALLRGIDPSPVERIVELKSRLDGA